MRARALAPVGVAATAAPAISGLWALCAWQARRARGGERPYTDALDGTARIGSGLTGAPLRVTWVGDSLAAGLGCDDVADTPAHLAARLLERPVDVTMLAIPGSKASDVIEHQLDHVDPYTDLVVLCVGANDVATSVARSVYARAGRPDPHRAGTDPGGDAHAARHLDGRPHGRAAAHAWPAPAAATSKPPAPRSPLVTTTSCRSTSPAARPASAAAPVAGCSAPTASTRAPRATGCGPSASPSPCSDLLEPPRLPLPSQPRSPDASVRCGRRPRCRRGAGPGRRGRSSRSTTKVAVTFTRGRLVSRNMFSKIHSGRVWKPPSTVNVVTMISSKLSANASRPPASSEVASSGSRT